MKCFTYVIPLHNNYKACTMTISIMSSKRLGKLSNIILLINDRPKRTQPFHLLYYETTGKRLLLFSHPVVSDSATPQTAAHRASLSITDSWSLLKLMSIESVMPSNHLILCRLLLLPSIFPSIRVFSNESVLPIRWQKY